MSDQALAITGPDRLRSIMRSPEVISRFAEIMGQHNASAYVTSVLLAVANNDDLQKCSVQSIISSAMRAATLRLSCDPATKQAHLVPFKGKATLVVGYKGFYDMAQRTGKYRYLNDFKIFEGQTVEEDQLTGNVRITGARTSDTITGYGFYFEMLNGFKKVLIMTVDEIREHGARYSKTYQYDSSLWKKDFPAMARKTVIRLCLSRYGYLDPNDAMTLNAVDDAEAEDMELPEPKPRHRMTEQQAMGALGYDDPPEDEPIEGEFIEPEPLPWTSTVVTLETAQRETSRDGEVLWSMDNRALAAEGNAIMKALHENHLEEGKRNELSLKRDVIRAILDYRKQEAQ